MRYGLNLLFFPTLSIDTLYVYALEGGTYVVQFKQGATLSPLKNTRGDIRCFTSLHNVKQATKRVGFKQELCWFKRRLMWN